MYIQFAYAVFHAKGQAFEIVLPCKIDEEIKDINLRLVDFMDSQTEDCVFDVEVSIYVCDAELAEVSDWQTIKERMQKNYRFLSEYCCLIDKGTFKVTWSPKQEEFIDHECMDAEGDDLWK